MPTIKLTSKRQVTFPRATCDDLKIGPGDELELTSMKIKSETVWVLKPKAKHDRSWIGMLHKYAKKATDHSMDAIRESIAKGRHEELTEKYR
ncbi:hypothetical protein BH11VER1_BH11VER1_26120 [soil metagenome]